MIEKVYKLIINGRIGETKLNQLGDDVFLSTDTPKNSSYEFSTGHSQAWYELHQFVYNDTKTPDSYTASVRYFNLIQGVTINTGILVAVTVKKFRDFIFKCDFKLTKAANSGIKYFYDETINGKTTLEYQILDGAHPDATKGRDGNRRVAALYDMLPSNADKYLKPLGEWNTAMIVSKGMHVEHWLNGVKVLEFERGGKAFMDAFAKSKYIAPKVNQNGKWGLTREGRIHIQDHGDSTVSYRNIKIKEL